MSLEQNKLRDLLFPGASEKPSLKHSYVHLNLEYDESDNPKTVVVASYYPAGDALKVKFLSKDKEITDLSEILGLMERFIKKRN